MNCYSKVEHILNFNDNVRLSISFIEKTTVNSLCYYIIPK